MDRNIPTVTMKRHTVLVNIRLKDRCKVVCKNDKAEGQQADDNIMFRALLVDHDHLRVIVQLFVRILNQDQAVILQAALLARTG